MRLISRSSDLSDLYDKTVHPDVGWLQWESQLDEAGVPIPLIYRAPYANTIAHDSWLIAERTGGVSFRTGCCVQVRRLPLSLQVLRVDHLGTTVEEGAEQSLARTLATLTDEDNSTIRLEVRVFHRDPDRRVAIGSALQRAGFERVRPGGYTRTVCIDLTSSEDAIFNSFSRSARRNIRAVAKAPLSVRVIDSERWIPRIDQLMSETLGRTGGVHVPRDWAGRLRLGREHPELSHLVGVFLNDRKDDESLLAIAWGCMHGDHGEYHDAASTRSDVIRLTLGHALVWDLIKWSRSCGASWFDLGGVTSGRTHDPDDRLGGISDFKRLFSEDMVDVAEEWSLGSNSLTALAATWAARLFNFAKRIR